LVDRTNDAFGENTEYSCEAISFPLEKFDKENEDLQKKDGYIHVFEIKYIKKSKWKSKIFEK
jgi:hypothetical protein